LTVSIPLVLLLGVVVLIAWRYLGLRVWQAIACLLCGFLLAATALAPDIQRVISAVVRWLSGA
jgi:ABC-type phosphate transport system auxiliary subunit